MIRQRGYIDWVFVCLLGGFGLAVVVALALAAWGDSYTCHRRAQLMRLESDWGPMQGCMVRVDDRWSPIEYIRIVGGKVMIQGGGE